MLKKINLLIVTSIDKIDEVLDKIDNTLWKFINIFRIKSNK